MQEFIDYNFLIIGRSGAGKSATSKLLTGDPSIMVANSINEVTKDVKFYRAISHTFNHEQIRFGILDIPGLDKITNRFELRDKVLQFLQLYKISLNGIIYVASLTERDPIDQCKLFGFLDQLPWNIEAKKSSLIPILTKYDNFIIDSPEEDIIKTKEQFAKIFSENGYGGSWCKRIYWVNYTKSLQFKLKCYEDIREKHQNQIQRLIHMVRKNKKTLTAESIEQQVKLQHQCVISELMHKIDLSSIPFIPQQKSHRLCLNIRIEPKKLFQSVTAMSASSIGIVISRAMKHEIPTPLSILLMGVPLSLTILNLTKGNSSISGKVISKDSFNHKVMKDFTKICATINKEVEKQWNQINHHMQFYVEGTSLFCRLAKNLKQRFFIMDELKIVELTKETEFQRDEKKQTKQHLFYRLKVPDFDEDVNWQPLIEIQYKVKTYEEETMIKHIEAIQVEVNSK